MKIKFFIFYILTIAAGAFTCYAFIHDFTGNVETLTYVTISFGVNFVYYVALIFGVPFIKADSSKYDTITTTYTYDSSTGKTSTSVSTPEDKAEVAMIWQRIGLIVLCYIASPISHLVFLILLPIRCGFPRKSWGKALATILGVLIVAAVGTLPLSIKLAEDIAYGPRELEYELVDDGYVVVNCDSSVTSIKIPAKHNRKPVIGINYNAFENCKNLSSVQIPESLKFIGAPFKGVKLGYYEGRYLGNDKNHYVAFVEEYDKNSVSCKINEKTKIVCSSAFKDCILLESVKLPETIAYISSSTFANCKSIESIDIPESVTSIGFSAFSNCSSLKNIKLPDGLTSIGNGSFANCTSLESITIPKSVTSVGEKAFANCNNLTIYCEASKASSDWSSGWNSSDCLVIWDCQNAMVDANGYMHADIDGIHYALKDGVAVIPKQEREMPTDLIIPKTVTYKENAYNTEIGEKAFENNSAITTVSLPDGLTSIGDGAFENCTSLSSITLPSGLSSVGNNLFAGCNNLKKIILADSIKTIGERAFKDCSSLNEISLPSGLTSIGQSAFSGCASLQNIDIPDGVVSIGNYAFENCSSITAINVGVNNPQYSSQDGILYNKSKTVIIYIPKEVTTEYGNCIYAGNKNNPYLKLMRANNQSIKNCNIHSNTKFISEQAFYNCRSLTSATLPEGLVSIGYGVFEGCEKLKSVSIPNSIKYVGSGAFLYCYSLNFNLYDTYYYLGNANNPHLLLIKPKDPQNVTSCKINGSTKIICNGAFAYRWKIQELTIPASVTFIGSEAFRSNGIKNLYYSGNKEQWLAIEKIPNWNEYLPASVVHCSDGDLSLKQP